MASPARETFTDWGDEMTKASKLEDPWHVVRDADAGTMLFMPYLRKDHAERMAQLYNDIETERVQRLGGSRAHGNGDFYTAKPGNWGEKRNAASAAAKVLRDPKASKSAKAAAASALTQKRR